MADFLTTTVDKFTFRVAADRLYSEDHLWVRPEGQLLRLGVTDFLQQTAGDVVLSNCVINLSPDKATVFREAYRVLKPGGWLAISDIVTEGVIPEQLRQKTEVWASCIGGALEDHVYLNLVHTVGFSSIVVDSRLLVATLPEVKILSLTLRAFKPLRDTIS